MTTIPMHSGDQTQTAAELEAEWAADPRWSGVRRDYTADDVIALRGPVREEATLARRGAEKLWQLIQNNGEHPDQWIAALGAITGNQAVQQVRAGLQAIYLSGWQVAADGNLGGQTYPDQSLYPANSVPAVVRRINNALLRAGQIEFAEEGSTTRDWMAPIVADAEAGFGGPLNAYELMLQMIEAGAAGVHWEDQLASEKKCGHMGGKVLIPTGQHIRTLNAARLAADVAGVPSIIVARTDSLAATLLTSDHDERDRAFLTGNANRRGVLRGAERDRAGPGARARLRAIRRPALGRVGGARPAARAHLRRQHPLRVPRPEAGVQLLAQLQLEAPPG